jgi:hypothetical protein
MICPCAIVIMPDIQQWAEPNRNPCNSKPCKIAVPSQTSPRFWRVCSENEYIPENAISEQLFLQVVTFEQPCENQNRYFIGTPL